MLTIDFLANRLDTIPTLVKWFRNQWPDYFANRSNSEMEQGFLSEATRDQLPCSLVAFASGELVGTIVLREPGSKDLDESLPELGGLFVLEHYRKQGAGTELIRSGMKIALHQRYRRIQATTVAAANILIRLGWEYIKTVDHQDGQLGLYYCDLYELPDVIDSINPLQ